MLYIVDGKLCVDPKSQTALDPSCCAALKVVATNRDGSARG
jgi:hypothetical protein